MLKEDSNVKTVLRAFEERPGEPLTLLLSSLFILELKQNIVLSPWAKLVYLRSLSPLKNALQVSIQLPCSRFVWQSVLPSYR